MGSVDRLDGISRRGRRARCISLLVLILFSPRLLSRGTIYVCNSEFL